MSNTKQSVKAGAPGKYDELYFNCFSEALEYYIQEKNKPRNKSNYREARKMMESFVWQPSWVLIPNVAVSILVTKIKMNYWLDNPDTIPQEVIEDLDKVNADYFKMHYPNMHSTPTQKVKLEREEMDRVIERLKNVEVAIVDYCESNEEAQAVMGMPIISGKKLTYAVVSFIRTILADIITNAILSKDGGADGVKKFVDSMPDLKLIQKAMAQTDFKDLIDLMAEIDKPIKEMRDKLDDKKVDAKTVIFDTLSFILTVIENKFYHEFAQLIVKIRDKVKQRNKKKEAPTIFDKMDLNNAAVEAKLRQKAEAEAKAKKEEADKAAKAKPSKEEKPKKEKVIIPEIVENKSDGQMGMAIIAAGPIVEGTVIETAPAEPKGEVEQVEVKVKPSKDRIEDPTDEPIKLTDNVDPPESKGKKPNIITEPAKDSKSEPEQKDSKEDDLPDLDLPDEYKEIVEKNRWILDIVYAGWKAETRISYRFVTVHDMSGAVKMVQFMAFTTENVLNPAKSFTVDMGQVVNKEFGIWPNFDAHGSVFPVEECTIAYRLFLRGEDKKRKFNKELIHNIASFGFDGLSKDDKSKNVLYGENILKNNRHVALITLPYDQNHKKHYQNAATKMTKLIEESPNLIPGLDLNSTRFRVKSHDLSTGSVVFTNAKMSRYYLYGNEVAPVVVEFTLTPVVVKDANGKMFFKTDDKKIPIFDVKYNVIPEGQYQSSEG